MSTSKSPNVGYRELSAQLEQVLAQLQQPDVDIDDALRLHKEGMALVAALERHLAQAENTITKLQARQGGKGGIGAA